MKHSRRQKNGSGEPRAVQDIRNSEGGMRPSHQALLRLIDTADPAWPSTAAVLQEMADAGVEIDETALGIAAKLGAHRLAMLDARKAPDRRPAYHQMTLTGTSDSIVYYIRRGDVIKIGTTTAPVMRFTNLMPDEILAFEPGDIKREKVRHRQFDHLRCQGEHFRSAPELLEHARQLRRLHGAPDPSWPTVAVLRAERGKRDPLPPPVSEEKVTVAEACARFGLKRVRIAGWVHRGLISMAGHDDRGLQVFYVDHIIAVRDRTAQRVRRS